MLSLLSLGWREKYESKFLRNFTLERELEIRLIQEKWRQTREEQETRTARGFLKEKIGLRKVKYRGSFQDWRPQEEGGKTKISRSVEDVLAGVRAGKTRSAGERNRPAKS